MPDQHDTPGDPEQLRLTALARWENEGGAQPPACDPDADPRSPPSGAQPPG